MARDRNHMFQHIVLQGLWVLILAAFGYQHERAAVNFKLDCLDFGDEFGRQGDEAKKYRREVIYSGSLRN